jgi:UDP-glucose 4-epimerase
MTVLVTGSAGHLGEALFRVLRDHGDRVTGLDTRPSETTTHIGSVADRAFVRATMAGVKTVLHTATLHKPHVATHGWQQFVDTNVTGTLNLLEEAVSAGVEAFVFTSTTSVFGRSLTPDPGAPAVWVTEDLRPLPKNIYGVTKSAAEDLCEIVRRRATLPCIILRTARFFPEEDDDARRRAAYADANLKANELLFRRVDIEDVVTAHLLAAKRAAAIGFGKYIISATSPFTDGDLMELRHDAPAVVERYYPGFTDVYARRGWTMLPGIDRVYVNDRARRDLGWTPRFDFAHVLDALRADCDFRSPLAQAIGSKGYHAEAFADGPYPTEADAPVRPL